MLMRGLSCFYFGTDYVIVVTIWERISWEKIKLYFQPQLQQLPKTSVAVSGFVFVKSFTRISCRLQFNQKVQVCLGLLYLVLYYDITELVKQIHKELQTV